MGNNVKYDFMGNRMIEDFMKEDAFDTMGRREKISDVPKEKLVDPIYEGFRRSGFFTREDFKKENPIRDAMNKRNY